MSTFLLWVLCDASYTRSISNFSALALNTANVCLWRAIAWGKATLAATKTRCT